MRTLAQMIYRLYPEDEAQNRWSNAALLDAVAGLIQTQLRPGSPDPGTRCVEAPPQTNDHQLSRQDFSLPEAVAASGSSAGRLRVLFKSSDGVTLQQYLQRLRMDYVEQPLPIYQDNLTLAEIARLYGFSDESYFLRTFRQPKGRSPRGKAQAAPAGAKGWNGIFPILSGTI